MKSNAIFSIDIPILVRLDEFSKKTERPKSAIVRSALTAYLDSQGTVVTEEQTAKVCELLLGTPSRRNK